MRPSGTFSNKCLIVRVFLNGSLCRIPRHKACSETEFSAQYGLFLASHKNRRHYQHHSPASSITSAHCALKFLEMSLLAKATTVRSAVARNSHRNVPMNFRPSSAPSVTRKGYHRLTLTIARAYGVGGPRQIDDKRVAKITEAAIKVRSFIFRRTRFNLH